MTMTGAQAAKLARSYVGSGPSTFYSYYSKHAKPTITNGPWCACFASSIVMMAGATCAGLPGIYCPSMCDAAKRAGATVAISQAKPGDIVYFNWDGNANADHVGICESVDATTRTITTIDGNVSNRVGVRIRKWYEVMSVVRPKYAAETPAKADTPATTAAKKGWHVYNFTTIKQGAKNATVAILQAVLNVRAGARLAIDGYAGAVTIAAVKAWQKAHGLLVDGIVGPVTWASLLGA